MASFAQAFNLIEILSPPRGHLVIITSKEENSFVGSLMMNGLFWIGCADEKKEGDWRWVDGSEVVFAGWAGGQPDNHGGRENYGSMGFRSSKDLDARILSLKKNGDLAGVLAAQEEKKQSGNESWDDNKDNAPVAGYVCEWDR